jgi:hypothetical protein
MICPVTNTNDDPEIELPGEIPLVYDQYDEIIISPYSSDVDPDDLLEFDINIDHITGKNEPLSLQLSGADLKEGYDWIFSPATGELILWVNDQNLWYHGGEMLDQVVISLDFKVIDSDGGFDLATIELTLIDLNEPPPHPDMFEYSIIDEDPELLGYQGLTVEFSAYLVEDPDMDDLTYLWDFGDGQKGSGIVINHTFSSEGSQMVLLRVTDGTFTTEPREVEIYLVDHIREEQPSPDKRNDSGLLLFLLSFVIILLLIGIITIMILIFKKQPIGEETKEE